MAQLAVAAGAPWIMMGFYLADTVVVTTFCRSNIAISPVLTKSGITITMQM